MASLLIHIKGVNIGVGTAMQHTYGHRISLIKFMQKAMLMKQQTILGKEGIDNTVSIYLVSRKSI